MQKSDLLALPITRLRCPNCTSSVIKSYGEEVKLRSKLLKWTREGMFAICKSCGEDVPIGLEVLKSIQSTFSYEIDKNS